MRLRDIVGLLLVCGAALAAALGYRILGTAWNIGFALLGALGLCLLWSAARARRLELWGVDNAATPSALDLLNGFPDSDD
jgi:Flp pilus assembly protein TadB